MTDTDTPAISSDALLRAAIRHVGNARDVLRTVPHPSDPPADWQAWHARRAQVLDGPAGPDALLTAARAVVDAWDACETVWEQTWDAAIDGLRDAVRERDGITPKDQR